MQYRRKFPDPHAWIRFLPRDSCVYRTSQASGVTYSQAKHVWEAHLPLGSLVTPIAVPKHITCSKSNIDAHQDSPLLHVSKHKSEDGAKLAHDRAIMLLQLELPMYLPLVLGQLDTGKFALCRLQDMLEERRKGKGYNPFVQLYDFGMFQPGLPQTRPFGERKLGQKPGGPVAEGHTQAVVLQRAFDDPHAWLRQLPPCSPLWNSKHAAGISRRATPAGKKEWVACIMFPKHMQEVLSPFLNPGTRPHVGYFFTEHSAQIAHDQAVVLLQQELPLFFPPKQDFSDLDTGHLSHTALAAVLSAMQGEIQGKKAFLNLYDASSPTMGPSTSSKLPTTPKSSSPIPPTPSLPKKKKVRVAPSLSGEEDVRDTSSLYCRRYDDPHEWLRSLPKTSVVWRMPGPKSPCTGVRVTRKPGRWEACFFIPVAARRQFRSEVLPKSHFVYIGSYASEPQAQVARDQAVVLLQMEIPLNFPPAVESLDNLEDGHFNREKLAELLRELQAKPASSTFMKLYDSGKPRLTAPHSDSPPASPPSKKKHKTLQSQHVNTLTPEQLARIPSPDASCASFQKATTLHSSSEHIASHVNTTPRGTFVAIPSCNLNSSLKDATGTALNQNAVNACNGQSTSSQHIAGHIDTTQRDTVIAVPSCPQQTLPKAAAKTTHVTPHASNGFSGGNYAYHADAGNGPSLFIPASLFIRTALPRAYPMYAKSPHPAVNFGELGSREAQHSGGEVPGNGNDVTVSMHHVSKSNGRTAREQRNEQ